MIGLGVTAMALLAASPIIGQDISPRTSITDAVKAATAPDCAVEPDALGCRKSETDRYRLTGSGEQMPDSKARAYANDGNECNLVGDKRCTSNGIPFMRQDLSPQR